MCRDWELPGLPKIYRGRPTLDLEASLQALRLVIAPSEGDGFLSMILSGLNVKAEASLGLGITLLSGVTLQGGAKLALAISTHIELGPVKIQGLRLALAPTKDQFRLETGVVFQFDLGPLKGCGGKYWATVRPPVSSR